MKPYTRVIKYTYYGVLAAALIAALVLGIMVYQGVTKYRPVKYKVVSEEYVAENLLCTECHVEKKFLASEAMGHPLPPYGVDHKAHLEAAIRMAEKGTFLGNKTYPRCYACHETVKAEVKLSKTDIIRLCTSCHSVSKIKLHDKMLISGGYACTLCHCDWDGTRALETLTGFKMTSTRRLCDACHTKIKKPYEEKLTEMHSRHAKFLDCNVCHKPREWTHELFSKSIEVAVLEACSKCHKPGLHGVHYSSEAVKKLGYKPECTVCHPKGEGARTWESTPALSAYCMRCHKLDKTSFHEKLGKYVKTTKGMCLACHRAWKGEVEAYPHATGETCNVCHPGFFTLRYSIVLHEKHLAKAIRCIACHKQIPGYVDHETWIHSAHDINVCYKCHDTLLLAITHKDMFKKTRDCFKCHYEWAWPKYVWFGR